LGGKRTRGEKENFLGKFRRARGIVRLRPGEGSVDSKKKKDVTGDFRKGKERKKKPWGGGGKGVRCGAKG